MLVSPAASTARPLVSSLVVPDGDGPRERSAIVAGGRSVDTVAGATLPQAVAYASSLAAAGWAGSVGVLQAGDGWRLVALEAGDGSFALDAVRGTTAGAVDRLQRHSYDLAAVVGARAVATWSGRERIAQLRDVTSPVRIPAGR